MVYSAPLIIRVRRYDVEYQYSDTESEEFDNLFIEYLGFNTGDIVSELDEVIVVVYPLFTGERTFVILPDISGLNKDEIQILFDNINVDIVFFESGEATLSNELEFNSYGQFLNIGDIFILGSELPIVIYPVSRVLYIVCYVVAQVSFSLV